MLQTGVIEKLHYNNIAEVKITRSSACGDNCASCGLCPGQSSIINAINDINASVGDTVVITMSDKKVLGAAFLVYIVPLIMLIAGYFIGAAVFDKESPRILTGFFMMATSFAVITYIDKKIKRSYTPHISHIINIDK